MRVRLGRVRFKLRTLVLLVAVCAVSIGVFFESIRRSFRAERKLAAEVENIGGRTFAVDYQPDWLKAVLRTADSITSVLTAGKPASPPDSHNEIGTLLNRWS
jgi:hypothetical protein